MTEPDIGAHADQPRPAPAPEPAPADPPTDRELRPVPPLAPNPPSPDHAGAAPAHELTPDLPTAELPPIRPEPGWEPAGPPAAGPPYPPPAPSVSNHVLPQPYRWLLHPDRSYRPRHAYRREEVLPHEPGYGTDLTRFHRPGSGMPLPVQAARTLAWVHAAGGVLLIFVTALSSGAISAAETLATYCCALILGASAFFFEHGGNGIRTTAVVVTAVSVLIGLIGLGHPYPTGLLGLAASIAILALLFHPGAVTWFRRPAADRTHPEPAPNRWLHTIGDLAPEFPRRLRDTRLPQPAHRRRSQAGRVVPAARRRWEARRRH